MSPFPDTDTGMQTDGPPLLYQIVTISCWLGTRDPGTWHQPDI